MASLDDSELSLVVGILRAAAASEDDAPNADLASRLAELDHTDADSVEAGLAWLVTNAIRD